MLRLSLSLLLLFVLAGCSHPGSRAPTATPDLVLIAGQSNAVGYDAYASELPPDAADRDVMFWWRVGDPPPDDYDVTSGVKWTHLQPQPKGTPMETTTAEAKTKSPRQYGNFKKAEGGFGPEMGLARELRAREGRPLAMVKAAFSGTALMQDWNPDDAGPTGACYRALVTESKAALVAALREQTAALHRNLAQLGERERARFEAVAALAQADQALDGAALQFLGRQHDAAQAIAALESEADGLGELTTIGEITIACALGYLDFRYANEPWRGAAPKLAAWYERVVKLPPLAQTMPVG
jgi:hypothetical protein